MRMAYHLGRQVLSDYTNKFSRKDYTQPQLLACLVLKEHLKNSYRGAEAILRDAENWLRDIGLDHTPDHNTLQRAAQRLLKKLHVDRLLDAVANWAGQARILKLSTRPLAIDSTTYESHHVSRHYEQRCHETRKRMRQKELEKRGRYRTRSETVRGLPKLGIGVATGCHLVLSYWSGTGAGSDQPHFRPVLNQIRQRVPHKHLKVVCDAGYDSEGNHLHARNTLGIRTVIPPDHGRPPKDGGPPKQYWRRRMKRLMVSLESRQRCGYTQRSQNETVHSMMKRNCSSALAGKSAWSRRRDMALKLFTHDVQLL
jgi:hypothetical protein